MDQVKLNVKNRENGLDLLRILSALAVILIHVNALYFRARSNLNCIDATLHVESIINIVTRFCVPSFVMISGAFVLNNQKNADIRAFYRKSLYKIFLPFFVALGIFLLFDEARCIIDGNLNALVPIKRAILGGYYNLWYMYMLLGLYMLTPFIIKLKQKLTDKQFCTMSVVMCIWAVVSQALSAQEAAYTIGVVFAYTSYYTLGSVLMTAKKKVSFGKNLLLVLVALLMYAITFLVRYRGVSYYLFNAYKNFFSPTIMIASICIFKLFLNLNIKKDLSKFSGYTFYIYLFHTIIYKSLNEVLISRLPFKNELAIIVVLSIATFILALIAAVIYKKIWDFANRKGLEKKWNSMKIWER
jgi:surface polysaccharide O-acyltransferase-like enzyme